MDAIIIILIILVLVLLFKRTFSSAIYAIVIVDIFLRLIDFLRGYLRFGGEIGNFLNRIPASLNSIIEGTRGTIGIFADVLLWVIFIVYVIFLGYNFAYFLRKK